VYPAFIQVYEHRSMDELTRHGDQPPVILSGQARLPESTDHARSHPQGEDRHHQQRKAPTGEKIPPPRGSHGQGSGRTDRLATQTAGAFRAADGGLTIDRQTRWAGLGALAAIDAGVGIATNLEWAEKTEKTEQRPIGAEITAPEVLIEERQQGNRGDDCQSGRRHADEEMEHLHVAHRPVGGFKKGGESKRRHVEEDDLGEEGQKQIFQPTQRPVEPGPDAEVAAENSLPQLPYRLGQGAHGTEPGAETLTREKAHGDEGQQENHGRRMDLVDDSRRQPVFQADQGADREKPFDPGRAGDIGSRAEAFVMADKKGETDADPQNPGKKEPLNEVAYPGSSG